MPFLTMEFLAGETLAARIARKGRLSPAEVSALLPQIVAGRVGDPRRRHRPPGHQAPEHRHPAGLARTGGGHRLRPGAGAGQRTLDGHRPVHGGHGRLHEPRADRGPPAHARLRRVRPGGGAVRDADRAQAVRRRATHQQLPSAEPGRPRSLGAGARPGPRLGPAGGPLSGARSGPPVRQRRGDRRRRRRRRGPAGRCRAAPASWRPRRRWRWCCWAVLAAIQVARGRLAAVAAAGWRSWARSRAAPARAAFRRPRPVQPGVRRQRLLAGHGGRHWTPGRFCIDRFEAAVVDDVQERPLSPLYPPWGPAGPGRPPGLERAPGRGPGGQQRQSRCRPSSPTSSRGAGCRGRCPGGRDPAGLRQPAAGPGGLHQRRQAPVHRGRVAHGLPGTGRPAVPLRRQRISRDSCNIDREVHPALVLHGVVHSGVLRIPA